LCLPGYSHHASSQYRELHNRGEQSRCSRLEKWNCANCYKSQELGAEDDKVRVWAGACTVSAHWNIADVQSTFNGINVLVDADRLSTTEQSGARKIDLDFTATDTLQSASFHHSLAVEFFKATSGVGVHMALAAVLAIWIANLPISGSLEEMLEYSDRGPLKLDIPAVDYTAYRFIAREFGYGYGPRSTSLYLSMAVLLSYCIIVIGYILYTLVTGLVSTAWNSGVESITLALQSKRPDRLGYTSVEFNSFKTLSESVGIRVNTDNELELVFAHDRDF
jgi:hypothetical protein